MLLEEDLVAFFRLWGISAPFSYDGWPFDDARKAPPVAGYQLTISGGMGLTMEDVFDRPTFQILTRAQSGIIARDMALALDRIWIDALAPFDLGEYRVTRKGRTGGPPTYLLTDDRDRVLRTCNYWLEIER